jgi:hypothetical protein
MTFIAALLSGRRSTAEVTSGAVDEWGIAESRALKFAVIRQDQDETSNAPNVKPSYPG